MTKLTKENIETQIMLYVDNELPAGEARDLLAFLEQHPEYKILLGDYQDSVLQPEEMVFPNKKQLLQAGNVKVVPLRIVSGVAAAIVIILAFAGYYQWTNNDDLLNNKEHLTLNRIGRAANSQPQIVAEADSAGPQQDTEPVQKPSQRPGQAQNVLPVNAPMVATQGQQKNIVVIKPMALLPAVAIAEDSQQSVAVVVAAVVPDLSSQQPILAQKPAQQREELPASQIAAILEQSDRLKGVHSLVAELDERKNRAVEAWQQIKSANVILKIGSKDIVIN